MLASLLASLLVAIEIHASGDCPGAADVERQLAPLLGDGTAAVSDVAKIESDADGSVSVSLTDAGGQAVGDRRLPRARTCGDQAKTVAVTLAIWEAQLHPEISLRLDQLSPEAPAPPPAHTPPTLSWLMPVPQPNNTQLWLGVAALGDYQSGELAPGARLELALGQRLDRWRARFGVTGMGRHTMDVPPGQASWWRAYVQLGADVDLARGRRWAVVFGAGGLGGVASISGGGFAVNRSNRSLDLGFEARARVQWRPGRVRPWLGAQVAGWARRQALDLQGAPSTAALPSVEPVAALGADFVW